MICTLAGEDIGLHAAEANSFLECVVEWLLPRHGARMGALPAFQAVGANLVRILRLIRLHKDKFPEADAEVSFRSTAMPANRLLME